MISINANIKSLIGRLIILIAFLIILFLIINYGILIKERQDGFGFFIFLSMLIGLMSLGVIASFFGIIKVEADNALERITFTRFYSKKIIQNTQITGYYTSVYNTKHGTSYGRIIKTNDNKIRELNPGNLKDVLDIDEYLNNYSIINLGEKRSLYPFTTGL